MIHLKCIQILLSYLLYEPYFSLYIHVHNTKNSHKILDLQRRYYIQKVCSQKNEKFYTSNIFVSCIVYDSKNNIHEQKEAFCKCIPLLDPIHLLMNSNKLNYPK